MKYEVTYTIKGCNHSGMFQGSNIAEAFAACLAFHPTCVLISACKEGCETPIPPTKSERGGHPAFIARAIHYATILKSRRAKWRQRQGKHGPEVQVLSAKINALQKILAIFDQEIADIDSLKSEQGSEVRTMQAPADKLTSKSQ